MTFLSINLYLYITEATIVIYIYLLKKLLFVFFVHLLAVQFDFLEEF